MRQEPWHHNSGHCNFDMVPPAMATRVDCNANLGMGGIYKAKVGDARSCLRLCSITQVEAQWQRDVNKICGEATLWAVAWKHALSTHTPRLVVSRWVGAYLLSSAPHLEWVLAFSFHPLAPPPSLQHHPWPRQGLATMPLTNTKLINYCEFSPLWGPQEGRSCVATLIPLRFGDSKLVGAT